MKIHPDAAPLLVRSLADQAMSLNFDRDLSDAESDSSDIAVIDDDEDDDINYCEFDESNFLKVTVNQKEWSNYFVNLVAILKLDPENRFKH